jgi:hypothetical protein
MKHLFASLLLAALPLTGLLAQSQPEEAKRYELVSYNANDEVMLFDTATGEIYFLEPYQNVWNRVVLDRQDTPTNNQNQVYIDYLRNMVFTDS